MPQGKKKRYEGRTKILYEGPEQGTLIQYFKDVPPEKGSLSPGVGILNNRISEHLMRSLTEIGVPNHFLKRVNMREQLIHEADIIPLRTTVRNKATGDFAQRMGLKEGETLPRPIVEFHLRRHQANYPLVTEEYINAYGWASPQEIEDMVHLSLRTNDFLSGLFMASSLRLMEFHLEFGRFDRGEEEQVVLVDEISPNCLRVQDYCNHPKNESQGASQSGDQHQDHQEIARRLGVLPRSNIQEFLKVPRRTP